MDLRVTRPLAVPRDDLYQAFTHSHLLTGVEAILVNPGIDRAITGKCFLALSTTYFGIKHHEKAVTSRGLSQYGNALHAVHEALQDQDASRSFDVLEAVMIMAVIEVRSLVKCSIPKLTELVSHLRTCTRLGQSRAGARTTAREPRSRANVVPALVIGIRKMSRSHDFRCSHTTQDNDCGKT